MSAESVEPSKKQQEILALYGVLAGQEAIQRHTASTRPVLINELVAFANGLTGPRDAEISARVGSELTLRRQYRDLITTSAVDSFAKPRAAHSASIFDERRGANGVVLKLKAAQQKKGQYYLIIEVPAHLAKSSDQPVILHAFTTTQAERAVFPPLHDGRTQIVISETDAVFAVLHDHDVEIDIK